MNFDTCPKCKLTLPNYMLIPLGVIINGQRKIIKVCEKCAEDIKKENMQRRPQ